MNVRALSHNLQTEKLYSELVDFRRAQFEESRLTKIATSQTLLAIRRSQERLVCSSDCSRITLNEIRDLVEQAMALSPGRDIVSAPRYKHRSLYNENTKFYEGPNFVRSTVHLPYLEGYFPLGSLQARLDSFLASTDQSANMSSHDFSLDQIVRFELTYKAPLWLSTLVMRVVLKVQSQYILTNWSWKFPFSMQRCNLDPGLRRCLDSLDVHGLRRIFSEGRARANDYLPNGWPLLYVS